MGGMYEFNVGMDVSEALGSLLVMAGTGFLSSVVGIICYVLLSVGLYSIASRRGIKHAWMAWLPVLNMWILGSIADQYQYVAKGQIRSRRKVLLGLRIVAWVFSLLTCVSSAYMLLNIVVAIRNVGLVMSEQMLMQLLEPLMGSVLAMAGALFVLFVVAVVLTVFQYIAYYDLYASCMPEHKVLFLVLSILFETILIPVFVFACRKKDLGMPPRKSAAPAAVIEPVVVTPEAAAEEPAAETVEE